jgi:predicted Fe-Mo cluster-binding NifX family protein
MRLAIPIRDSSIATVADFAHVLMVVDYDNNVESGRNVIDFHRLIVPARVAVLDDNGVTTLICGAISRPFATMVIHCGIELIPFMSGNVDEVITAYFSGDLANPRFFMPGRAQGMHWCFYGGKGMRGRGRHGGGGGKRRGIWP